MASTINTTNIDENYPVAGQDNDSQGFRDNFLAIKTGLGVAKSEITALQDNAGGLETSVYGADEGSDFNDRVIARAELRDTSYTAPGRVSVSDGGSVDYTAGHYQRIQLNEDTELTIANSSPNNTLTHLTIDVTATGSTRTFALNTASGANLYKQASLTFPMNIELNKVYIFNVWSPDNGTTLFVDYNGEYVTA